MNCHSFIRRVRDLFNLRVHITSEYENNPLISVREQLKKRAGVTDIQINKMYKMYIEAMTHFLYNCSD